MSFGSQPTPPDPNALSNTQQGFNIGAAKAQNQGNMFNQTTPFGNLSWTADPNAPGGYSANTSLNPQEQQLLDAQIGLLGGAQSLQKGAQGLQGSLQPILSNLQSGLGASSNSLLSGMPSIFSNLEQSQLNGPPSEADTTNKLMGWNQAYMAPIYEQQQKKLDAQLQNQGLTPGSEAYNNAQNLQARNVADAQNQFFMMAQPAAFSQSMQQYQAPFNTASSLVGNLAGITGQLPQTTGSETTGTGTTGTGPTMPTMQQTPTAQVQPPNYMGTAEQQYAQQLQQYQQQQQGMWGLAGAGVNALTNGGQGGFGKSLLGMSMFG